MFPNISQNAILTYNGEALPYCCIYLGFEEIRLTRTMRRDYASHVSIT